MTTEMEVTKPMTLNQGLVSGRLKFSVRILTIFRIFRRETLMLRVLQSGGSTLIL